MGGHEDLGYGASLDKIEIGGYFYQQTLVNEDIFRLRAASRQAHHTLSQLPLAHQRPYSINLASKFDPWNVLRRTSRGRISSHALQQLGAIDARGAYTHAHLFTHRLRRRDVLYFKHFRAAGPGDNYCFHERCSFIALASSVFLSPWSIRGSSRVFCSRAG